jgi:hypothetical protein
VLGGLLTLGSCGSTSTPSNVDAGAPSGASYDVYLAGTVEGASFFNTMPCYWKNGVRANLDVSDGKAGVASRLFVSGGDVYVSGAVHSLNGQTYHPSYWRNSARTDLSELDSMPERQITLTFAQGILVWGGRVYVSGTAGGAATQRASYWVDGVRNELPGVGDGQSQGGQLQVVDGDVYVAGRARNAAGVFVPCLWRNGIRTELPVLDAAQHGGAGAVQVSGSSVYAAGSDSGLQSPLPCYWRDGVRVALPLGENATSGDALGLAASGADIYVAGSVRSPAPSSACYWRNGVRVALPARPTDRQSFATDIVVVDGSVYVSGWVEDASRTSIPGYWKDGVLTTLPEIGTASSIRVVAR